MSDTSGTGVSRISGFQQWRRVRVLPFQTVGAEGGIFCLRQTHVDQNRSITNALFA